MSYKDNPRRAPGRPFRFSKLNIRSCSFSCNMPSKELPELTFRMEIDFSSPAEVELFTQGHLIADDGRVVGIPTETIERTIPVTSILAFNVTGMLYELPTIPTWQGYVPMPVFLPECKCNRTVLMIPGDEEHESYPTKFKEFKMQVEECNDIEPRDREVVRVPEKGHIYLDEVSYYQPQTAIIGYARKTTRKTK